MNSAQAADRRAQYVQRVTAGEGFMPWQTRDQVGASEAERTFRTRVERRKDAILAARVPVAHPVSLDTRALETARANARTTAWGRQWLDELMGIAEHVANQPDDYVEQMIPELTPMNPYGFTCPACVGTRSQEGVGVDNHLWDYRRPQVFRCKTCGQELPHADFPELGAYSCPRSGQQFTYYLPPAQRAAMHDRSGALAWKWVDHPTAVSYTGIVRHDSVLFMTRAALQLGIAYRLTGERRFAARGVEILLRFAHCTPLWLYHDCYGTMADCDPLFAAWHDMALPLDWNRNPFGEAYTDMFLAGLIWVPETLHGFRWPEGYPHRQGTVDVYTTDAKLRRIFTTTDEQLRENGHHIPVSDTVVNGAVAPHIFEIAAHRYPESFAGRIPRTLRAHAEYRGLDPASGAAQRPTEYAVFHLTPEQVTLDRTAPKRDTLFPDWRTAILRHGAGPTATALALPFNPPGIHRQMDSLGIYYEAAGRAILGDQGYVCDTPMLHWIHSAFSHNLVIVDQKEQAFWPGWGGGGMDYVRQTRLHFMAATPMAAAVEASSTAYPQCRIYRRMIVLVRGPEGRSFVVDVFRVAGGARHEYRLFSEIGCNHAADHAMTFRGLAMPALPPMPDFGNSIDMQHIYGLRDPVDAPGNAVPWSATWSERGFAFRTHVLSAVQQVVATHGPGQETAQQAGRRVRYLGLVNTGTDLRSTLIAVHEPADASGVLPELVVRPLSVDPAAGPDAAALEVQSPWGGYVVLNEFARPASCGGVEFQGTLAVVRTGGPGDGMLSVGAERCQAGDWGFAQAAPRWTGKVVSREDGAVVVDAPPPPGFTPAERGATAWMVLGDAESSTGYEVDAIDGRRLVSRRFPLPEPTGFVLPSVRYITKT